MADLEQRESHDFAGDSSNSHDADYDIEDPQRPHEDQPLLARGVGMRGRAADIV